MTEQEIARSLDRLAAIREELARNETEHHAALKSLMSQIPKEIQDAMDAVNGEYTTKNIAGLANARELEYEIRCAILAIGKSVRGDSLHGVWSKGRVSWDTSKLDGLAVAIPQLLQLRSEGEPSVSIRAVTKKPDA